MDAAIALTETGMVGTATPDGVGYGTPNTTTIEAYPGQQVQKFGRTTMLTTGEVAGINATGNVTYGNDKTAKFVKQIKNLSLYRLFNLIKKSASEVLLSISVAGMT